MKLHSKAMGAKTDAQVDLKKKVGHKGNLVHRDDEDHYAEGAVWTEGGIRYIRDEFGRRVMLVHREDTSNEERGDSKGEDVEEPDQEVRQRTTRLFLVDDSTGRRYPSSHLQVGTLRERMNINEATPSARDYQLYIRA